MAVTRRLLSAIALLGFALGIGRTASAFERQQHVGLDGGFTFLKVNDLGSPGLGASFGAHYAYGISDAFNLVAEAQYQFDAMNLHLGPAVSHGADPSYVVNGNLGAQYVFDVLRWVPYIGGLAGGYFLGGGNVPQLKPLFGLELEVGLDYQITRNLAVGAAYHEHFLVTDMSTYPAFFNVMSRVEYVWGW